LAGHSDRNVNNSAARSFSVHVTPELTAPLFALRRKYWLLMGHVTSIALRAAHRWQHIPRQFSPLLFLLQIKLQLSSRQGAIFRACNQDEKVPHFKTVFFICF
jgi:hypothetical protein